MLNIPPKNEEYAAILLSNNQKVTIKKNVVAICD